MEDWISALKSVQKWETYEVSVSFNVDYVRYLFSCLTTEQRLGKWPTCEGSCDCVDHFDENRLCTSVLFPSDHCTKVPPI